MGLTKKWEGYSENWHTGGGSSTVVYSGPWGSRDTDKNAVLGSQHPDISYLYAITDTIKPWGDASDIGGPKTAKHTVTYRDLPGITLGEGEGEENIVQNAMSDWTEHWENGGEAITIGEGFAWASDGKKVKLGDVAAVKLFPTATISLTGTTSRFDSNAKTVLLNLVGKINRKNITIKGRSYASDHVLYLGTGADQVATNLAGSDIYRLTYNFAYRHDNSWNEFWRKDKPGGPGWDTLVNPNDGTQKAYSDAIFSDMDPKYW